MGISLFSFSFLSSVSFHDTTMAKGTKTRFRARLAPEQHPGHNLSLAEALQVVNAKLAQADDAK